MQQLANRAFGFSSYQSTALSTGVRRPTNQWHESRTSPRGAYCDSGLVEPFRHPSTNLPRTPEIFNCPSLDDIHSHTFSTGAGNYARFDEQEFDFELFPHSGHNLYPKICFNPIRAGSEAKINSTQFTNSPRQSNYPTSPFCSRRVDLEVSAQELRCDWPQCSSLDPFESIDTHKSHIKHHAQEVSNKWSPGQKCTWHRCTSNASQRNRNLFDTHINNIHVNPLLCTVLHCKHKRPFRANHDLQRHIDTAHNVSSRYQCPYSSCRSRGFIRKDKFIRHLKEHHDTEPCPYAHCQRQTDMIPLHQRSISKHIGKAHGSFECALGNCKGKISGFAESQLLEHLQLHHAMEWPSVLKARDMIKAKCDRTLTASYLKQCSEVQDCRICIQGSY